LIPGLRANAHAAASALLILAAGQTCAAAGGEAVKSRKPLRLNELAQAFTFGLEYGLFARQFLLTQAHTLARLFERARKSLHLGSGRGEHSLLGFAALQAGEFVPFEPFNLSLGKFQFMLDRLSLGRSRYGVKLGANTRCFLPVAIDVALKASAQGIFPCESVGGAGRVALCGGQGCFCLGDFCRQGACRLSHSGAFQFHALQLHQVFNVR
jgi:hypothetical protein